MTWAHDRPVCRLGNVPPSMAASACAERIMECATPRAVSIDPDGRVWIEPPCDACPDDVVGVYARSLGLRRLTDWLRDDLAFEWGKRRDGVPARRYGPRRAKRAEAA